MFYAYYRHYENYEHYEHYEHLEQYEHYEHYENCNIKIIIDIMKIMKISNTMNVMHFIDIIRIMYKKSCSGKLNRQLKLNLNWPASKTIFPLSALYSMELLRFQHKTGCVLKALEGHTFLYFLGTISYW